MTSQAAEKILARVFPNGIPTSQLKLAMDIASAIDKELGGSVETPDLREKSATRAPPDAKARLTAALREGATIAELSKITGTSKQAVRTLLARMEANGSKLKTRELPPSGPGRVAHVYRLID